MMTQAEFKQKLAATRSAHRQAMIWTIEGFVESRCDQERVELRGLKILSTRELEWIVAAIDNTGA